MSVFDLAQVFYYQKRMFSEYLLNAPPWVFMVFCNAAMKRDMFLCFQYMCRDQEDMEVDGQQGLRDEHRGVWRILFLSLKPGL